MTTIIKGFKFGMLLQIAIGPVCIYIFNTSINKGLIDALAGALAATIIDALFIFLSILGISPLIEKRKRLLKVLGVLVLLLFGIKIIIDALFMQETGVDSYSQGSGGPASSFLTVLFLTAANPLTIVFWAGVFSAKVIEEGFSRPDEMKFGLGALLSTVISLIPVIAAGRYATSFVDLQYIVLLNILVGILLLYFGVRLALKKV